MARNVSIGGNGDLFVGEDKTISLHVLDKEGVPVDILGWDITFLLRIADATSGDAVLTKTATVAGTYNIDAEVNTQRANVELTDTETSALSPRKYRYSFKRTDEGVETILAWGDFILQRATQLF